MSGSHETPGSAGDALELGASGAAASKLERFGLGTWFPDPFGRSPSILRGLVIRLDQISKQHGPQILFVDASAALFRGEKIGLVRAQRRGKSTIFRMIMREESPDEGRSRSKNITIGYFSQDVGEMKGLPVVAEVMAGGGPVSEVAAEMKTLEEALADPARADEMEKILARFGEVQARFDQG